MLIFFKCAVNDILKHRFLNTVTIITIALSVFIVSALALFFLNANNIMNNWKKGVKIMAYLESDLADESIQEIRRKIIEIYGVLDVRFISKDEALKYLKNRMERQSSLFDNLNENPLPDAFEVRMIPLSQTWDRIELLASEIEMISKVEEVEYGQRWLGRFSNIFKLFKLLGYAMRALFFMAAVLIVANTIRLVFYSRQEEIEIIRIVGASDGFIKAPFYIEGLIYGAVGGVIGLASLYIIFCFISSNVGQNFTAEFFIIDFLSIKMLCEIILCSMIVGWFGCFISLKHILKA